MRWLLLSLLLLGACRPSTRFALPAPQGSPQKVEFVWKEEAQPIMARGDQWDAVDTLNPSVVKWRGLYWNLYSGFDGKTWHTGTATSSDGMQWNHRRKVLSPDPAGWEGRYIAANGTALVDGDAVLYWYQAGAGAPAIGLARSRDGVAWQKEPRAVLDPGPRGSWDERGVADPYVIKSGEWFYLYYTGLDRAQRQRFGVARSRDGVTWQKSLDNPILDIGGHQAWDEGGLGEPAIWASHGSYWMLYTGRAWDEKRRIGMAKSQDGIHWEKLPLKPFEGVSAWDSAVICDPTIELAPDGKSVRVWFGGGDLPKPDERLNGQIGYATLVIQ
jgi:predicted GH43/DUF377 family glycosyl hydrolase